SGTTIVRVRFHEGFHSIEPSTAFGEGLMGEHALSPRLSPHRSLPEGEEKGIGIHTLHFFAGCRAKCWRRPRRLSSSPPIANSQVLGSGTPCAEATSRLPPGLVPNCAFHTR